MIKSLPSHKLKILSPSVGSDEPMLVDQSQAPMTFITNIIDTYMKTGMLPSSSTHSMTFVNDYEKPSFEEAHYVHQFAMEQLAKLPETIRNEIKNDYKKFETWLTDPENLEIAKKYGLIEIKPKEPLKVTETPPIGGKDEPNPKLP